MHHVRLCAIALAVALAAPLSQARAQDTTDMAAAVIDAMNVERASHGLAPLRVEPKLSAAASNRIVDMFDGHYFAHTSPTGLEPWKWVEQEGYDYREFGENLALGYPSAESVVDGWMHSPLHRANVLNTRFQEVGVAIAEGSPARPYHGPTVVAIYGLR